jgi:quinol monooxygenase YgiN
MCQLKSKNAEENISSFFNFKMNPFMNSLQANVRLKIQNGKLNEFKELAIQLVQAVKKNEPGTIQYDWFFNSEETECVVRESFVDSSAVIAHMTNTGGLLGKILQVSELSLEVFGNPSNELRTATTAMNPKIYSYFQGL